MGVKVSKEKLMAAAIRLVELLTRELEDVASAHAEELAGVAGFAMAMQWPAGSAA
jgi:hypothetical protein